MAVAAMLFVQLANAASASLFEHVGTAGTAWLRMCCGAVLLWLIARPDIPSLRWSDLPSLLVLGTATGMMTTFFLGAIDRIPLGTAVAIEFLGPLTVAGLASKNRRGLLWPLLALLGVVLLSEPWAGSIDLIGVGLALAAAACWGLYTVLTQRIGDRFSGISGLSLTIPIAAIATLPMGLPQVIEGELTWTVIALAASVALITPVIAFGLEMLALRRMTHTAFGTLLSIEPAFGILIGLVVLYQMPTLVQVVGIVLVILAGMAAQRDGVRTVDAEVVAGSGAGGGTDVPSTSDGNTVSTVTTTAEDPA